MKSKYVKGRNYTKKTDSEHYKIEHIVKFIENSIDEMLKMSLEEKGIEPEEFEKIENKKKRLQYSLKECTFGSIQDKQYVKEYIFELLNKTYQINENNVNLIIPFNEKNKMTVQDKFEIIMHNYKKQFGKFAICEIIRKYRLDEIRYAANNQSYCISDSEIEKIFEIEAVEISLKDKLDIIVQRVYSLYKGYNCIDDLIDMQIDGISGGVNGLPEDYIYDYCHVNEESFENGDIKKIPKSYDGIWLFFGGKSIHLSFLSFNSYEELERICQNIYKFGNPGQLSKMNGYKVNKLKDGSRVVVLRPDFCETWAFFIRKFDVPDISLEGLIKDDNAEMVIKMLKFLIKGSRNIAVTGAQGTGKTTLLNALLEHIYGVYSLRILEMAFELHLRKRFPERNIITIQETDTVSGQEGLDILKKTDGVVTIVGEVATDSVAAYMIQTAQVASKFTLFTHHAKTFNELVLSLRNSILKTGLFNNEFIAEEQIARILNFDVHIEKDIYGKRYVERITECIPADDEEYPEDFRKETTFEGQISAFMNTALCYFKKMTGGKIYQSKNIIEFDYENSVYVMRNKISEKNLNVMKANMTKEDRKEFEDFLKH